MLADLALFGEDAVANTGMDRIKRRESIGDSGGGNLEFNFAAPVGKLAQRTGNVKRYGHDQRLFVEFGFVEERDFFDWNLLRELGDLSEGEFSETERLRFGDALPEEPST